jgi:hypothetical protein
MRILTVSVLIILAAIPVHSQEISPDSTDTIFEPLDSLWTGLDLALDVLKMNREDLTFRGDYLEPDAYRLSEFDYFMEKPMSLVKIADRELKDVTFKTTFLSQMFNRPNTNSNYKTLKSHNPYLENIRSEIDNTEFKESLGLYNYDLLNNILNFVGDADYSNSIELSKYSEVQLDSIAYGFTLLLEERVEDEFLSVDEIDSLSEFEDDWALRLAEMSIHSNERMKLINNIEIIINQINNYSEDHKFQLDQGLHLFTDYGQIIIGDTTNNHYSGDIFIVLDPGGNDTYEIQFDGYGHHTYIIDYAGDDYYIMPKNRISPYFLGSNMIIDHEGDDIYNAGSWTLGAGLFGVGVLWDMKGNDKYFGDTFSQGAGCFGVGILRDEEGNDSYQAALFSQGFGFIQGVGVLQDNSGNDNYFAGGKYKDVLRYDDHYISLSQGFGYGLRPKMSGGVGMLIDKKGNDTYVSDIFGQGASYWYALGVLADGGGNDQYMSFQYAQGNGTHMSLGILYDVAGDDIYSAKGVSQGCGHDRAAGLLIDLDGNDNYNAFDLCQGAGSANGLGMIADVRGDDAYIVRSNKNTQGYGNPRRDYGSIGLFIDLGGKDGYSGGLGRDNHWWNYSTWGVGIDK